MPNKPIVGRSLSEQRILVAGPFSYPNWGATFGDTEALRQVEIWLQERGALYDVALHISYGPNGLDIEALDPDTYNTFVFVCGPWFDLNRDHLLHRFAHCRKIGVNLSILVENHGFDILLARDHGDLHNPDLVFATPVSEAVPLSGLILAPRQIEYRDRQGHDAVNAAVLDFLDEGAIDYIKLDTIYKGNLAGMTTLRQFENMVRRLDVVITTRLHGMVFALKNGIPAIVIDPIAGGGKVSAQAQAVEWPFVLDLNHLTTRQLRAALEACLSPEAKTHVDYSNALARRRIEITREKFNKGISAG